MEILYGRANWGISEGSGPVVAGAARAAQVLARLKFWWFLVAQQPRGSGTPGPGGPSPPPRPPPGPRFFPPPQLRAHSLSGSGWLSGPEDAP